MMLKFCADAGILSAGANRVKPIDKAKHGMRRTGVMI